jgi:hypothetical protein
VLAVALITVAAAPVIADPPTPKRLVIKGAERSAPVTPLLFEGDLRDLPRPSKWKPGDPIKEIPKRFYPRPGTEEQYESYSESQPDPLLGLQSGATESTNRAFTAPTRNFAGQDFTGANPPDTVGDVGPNHYIQMVNTSSGAQVRIYDKAEPTPNEITTFLLEAMTMSGDCASGFGDPIVLYDRLADRWMLSEFSSGGNKLCVYISQTPDPVTGSWFTYEFQMPSFPDYPKYGVWPTDANNGPGSYVVTANESPDPSVIALDRGAMLAGAAATFQRVTLPSLSGFSFQTATPADLDGPVAPPAQSPAVIMRHRDTENHGGPAAPGDLLEMWTYQVDWSNAANTTLTTEPSIDIAEIDSDLCGLTAFFCFPQPNSSTTLDPLREVIMNRLQYLNYEDYEALAGNLVTDVDGNDHGGLRWFELRNTGGGWTLYQEGTYAPDADHRWMAASALDQSGNFAIAYNVSSNTTFPSLRYTGRLVDDPLNVLTQAETNIHAGASPNSSNRYGDYSAMNLDPVDDCTFWFTGEDNLTTNWRTQIASFAFDACGCELEPLPLAVNAQATADNEITVDWNDSELTMIVEYLVMRSRTMGGPYETIAVVPDSSPGVGNGPAYFFADTDVSGGITYYYVVRASDGEACKSAATDEASATATGLCTLPPLFEGLQTVMTPLFATCTLDLTWNPAVPECGTSVLYNVHRSQIPGFTPDATNLFAEGVNTTTYTDMNVLVSGTRYYYVVRAIDASNSAEEDNLVEVSGVPLGPPQIGTWTDDAGDTGDAKLSTETPWTIDQVEGNLGPNVYKTGSYGDLTCAALTSPPLLLDANALLSFASRYDIESGWDKGEVQISIDEGTTWQRVEMAYPGTSDRASDNCGLPTGTYFTGTDDVFSTYSADLSAWSNQVVMIRFLMSSDGSVTGTGWWIDDIEIAPAGVPSTCATGSACEDNPFVNVIPEGPITVCTGVDQLLTADLSGGNGPFLYQWTQNGLDVAGANDSTFAALDLGTHAYNCRVQSESCPDDVSDGVATGITWVNAPFFDGVESVSNAGEATCTLDVAWSDAASVCPGPVTYDVYRDTTTPVSIVPGNLVAEGLSATSLADSEALLYDQTYYYVVRSVEGSTGADDGNVVEASGKPTGPGGGLQTLFNEDFEDDLNWSLWTVSTGPGSHTCGDWARATTADQRPAGSTGLYALTDSDACGSGSSTSTILDSPPVATDLDGLQALTLEYDIFYNHYNGDDSTVEVWDGAAWRVVWTDQDTDEDTHHVWDVTAYANPDFRVRFNYQNASYDWWFAVDNVVITADVSNPCSTGGGSPAPAPVPDGSASTTPLLGDRTDVSGATLQLFWDASTCPATSYNLIYGDLANVSSYATLGGECAIGTSGSFTWNAVPAGNLFYLIVGSDGTSTESSWGVDSNFNERNGSVASGECSVTAKDSSQTCP